MKGYRILLEEQELDDLEKRLSNITRTQSQPRIYKKNIEDIFFESFYIKKDGKYMIDAQKLNQVWYPQFLSDIFISHSHKDVDKAKKLARILYEKFGLIAFVDSFVWQSCDELLQRLDEKHCVLEYDDNGEIIFDYKQCMFSSSHVHMMLAVSLMQIINGAKSIFVLDTDQSLFDMDGNIKTSSPWIFFELALANLLIKKESIFEHTASIQNRLNICYPVNLECLLPLEKNELIKWNRLCKNGDNPLEVLNNMK